VLGLTQPDADLGLDNSRQTHRRLVLAVLRGRWAFVAPPLLTTFFGLRQLEAQGLALALISPSALVALWLMPKPVESIGRSDYRLRLVA